jgi:hypothetical protein
MAMLWGVSTYFSPHGASAPLANLARFSASVRHQGLPLLVVELAFGEQPFQVADTLAERVLRLRASDLMWQKERLLNLGIAALPDDCEYVAWLDNDILFENDDWVAQTAALLAAHALVQPFERVCWLGPNQSRLTDDAPLGMGEGCCLPGMAASMAGSLTPRRDLLDYQRHGHTGFAWAARRALVQGHGLYDRGIIGGGDLIMAHAFYHDHDFQRGLNPYSSKLGARERAAIASWSSAFAADLHGAPVAVPGRVLHLYHGALGGRGYQQRLGILAAADFDPLLDLALAGNGCWRWDSPKPALHQAVAEYLAHRGAATAPPERLLSPPPRPRHEAL